MHRSHRLPGRALPRSPFPVSPPQAKLLELKVQREAELEAQRRAVAAAREHKKAAAARRSHEVASAVRGRVAERQRDIVRIA